MFSHSLDPLLAFANVAFGEGCSRCFLDCAALLDQCFRSYSDRSITKRSTLVIRRILVLTRPVHERIETMVTRQKPKLAFLPNAVTAVVWRHGTGQDFLRNVLCNLDNTC
jgi:hypothetical protein